ncbi:MAG TPA: PilZ domain-containing protein [Thermoanaerobaculia bacterium]
MSETPDDRRQFGRVTPVQRIRGAVGSVAVYVIDVSLAGARVAHQDQLPDVGMTSVLTFEWEGRTYSGPCEVRRTKLERPARSKFDKELYHTGLFLMPTDRESQSLLREIVQTSVIRALDEQKANARGIPATAALSFQTGAGEDYVRCEMRQRAWVKTSTRDPQQPEHGFTISSAEPASKIAMLCRAYEMGDVDGRRLIRTFAALSISKAEGIPTRRYAP